MARRGKSKANSSHSKRGRYVHTRFGFVSTNDPMYSLYIKDDIDSPSVATQDTKDSNSNDDSEASTEVPHLEPEMSTLEDVVQKFPGLHAEMLEIIQREVDKKTMSGNEKNIDKDDIEKNMDESTFASFREAFDTLNVSDYKEISKPDLDKAMVSCVRADPDNANTYVQARATILEHQSPDAWSVCHDGHLVEQDDDAAKLNVSYWATVQTRDGLRETHIRLNEEDIIGHEKEVIEKTMCSIWEWVWNKNLEGDVTLYDAYLLAEQLHCPRNFSWDGNDY